VVRGHRQADPIVVGDVVRRERSRVPGCMFSLNRGMGVRLLGGAAVGLNNPGRYCSIGSAQHPG
jgi:hypothetical protein